MIEPAIRSQLTRTVAGCAALASLAAPPVAHAAWPTDPTVNVRLNTSAASKLGIRAVPDGAGGAIVVWLDAPGGANAALIAQHVSGGGAVTAAWPANGLQVSPMTTLTAFQEVVPDGAGGAFVAWTHRLSPTNSDVYAQHVLSSGQLDPRWPPNGRAVTSAPYGEDFVVMAADGSGGAILAWQHSLDASGTTDIYAHHLRSDGALDPSWPAAGRVVSDRREFQYSPRIVGDGEGGAIIAWSDGADGDENLDVLAQHVRADGTLDPAWPDTGRVLCAAAGQQILDNLVADRSDGAFAVWRNPSPGDGSISVQRVLADGTIPWGWPSNGASVGSIKAFDAGLVPDGVGNVYVAWTETGESPSTFYARVQYLADGAIHPSWPANGRRLRDAGALQAELKFVSDGGNGAVASWCEATASGDLNVFAQHVLEDGMTDPGWDILGRPVSTAQGGQSGIAMVSDDAGGAILAFNDSRRYPDNSVYAQRILSNGDLGGDATVVPPGGSSTLALSPAYPNPAREGGFLVNFTLTGDAPASIALYDAAGRRVTGRDVSSMGAGPHPIALASGLRLTPGIYVVRLEQAGVQRTTRVAILD